jgi:hypothetical protein
MHSVVIGIIILFSLELCITKAKIKRKSAEENSRIEGEKGDNGNNMSRVKGKHLKKEL